MRKIYNTFLRRILHKLYLEKYAIYINCWYTHFWKDLKVKTVNYILNSHSFILRMRKPIRKWSGKIYLLFWILHLFELSDEIRPLINAPIFWKYLVVKLKKVSSSLRLKSLSAKVVVQLFFKKPARDALKMQTWYR